MANKTIPQLPLQTGITDNDLLAIVDSGETTTSKIKLSTLLSGVGGGAFQVGDATNSIVPAYSPTSRGVSGSTTYVDKLNLEGEVFTSNSNETFNLVQSNTTITDNPYNRAFAGHGNSRINSTSTTGANMLIGTLQGQINQGAYHQLLGMGTINSTGNGCFIAGGEFTNVVQGGNYASLVGGASNSTNGNFTGIFAGSNNSISGVASFIGGGSQNNITNANSAIIGGNTNAVSGSESAIIASRNSSNSGVRSSILAGWYQNIVGCTSSFIAGGEYGTLNGTANGHIIGSWGTNIYHDNRNNQEGTNIIQGPYCNIRQTAGSGTGIFKGGRASIMNSWYCDIAGQSGNETSDATIIGSRESNIPGGQTHTVMIGCSGRTGTSDYTTYVETLEAFDGIVMTDYANLNFASDSAAAASGVPLGGMYHNSGDMKIRIT